MRLYFWLLVLGFAFARAGGQAQPIELYRNPNNPEEYISNIEAPSPALNHSFVKFKLYLDEEASPEEPQDSDVAFESLDSPSFSENDTFTVNLVQQFVSKNLEWEGFKEIECKLVLFELGKGAANFTLDPDWLNETKLEEKYPVSILPLFGGVEPGKRRAALVPLPSTFDRLAEQFRQAHNLTDAANSSAEDQPSAPDHIKNVNDPSIDSLLSHLGIGGPGAPPLRAAGGRGLSHILTPGAVEEDTSPGNFTDSEAVPVERHTTNSSLSESLKNSEALETPEAPMTPPIPVTQPSADLSSSLELSQSSSNSSSENSTKTNPSIEEILQIMKETDVLISKGALQDLIMKHVISKIEDDPSVDIVVIEVKQNTIFRLSSTLEEKKIVLPLYENKFQELLQFINSDNLEDPPMEVEDSPGQLMSIRVQNISTSLAADFEFEHHYTCSGYTAMTAVYLGLVFCFLVLAYMSIRMTSCENERGTSLGQKIIIIPNCLKLMTTSLTYYYFDQCPWVDISFAQYLLSLKMTWQTLESTFITMTFLIVLSGYQISHSSFERHLKLKFILSLTLVQYALDSTYQIVWTGEYTNQLRFLIHAFLNCFSLVMLILAVIVGYSNYQEALKKARETTDYIFFNNRVNDANYDAVQYYLNRLCDRAKMTLASTLVIALYYMSELFIHGLVDLYLIPIYRRTSSSNNSVQLLHQILDLAVLYCLTFAISPHFYFTPRFVRRLFLCPYNVCLPDVGSQNYIDAMTRYQLRPDYEVEEQIELEVVNQGEDRRKIQFGELNLKKLSKDDLAIRHLLLEGDRVDEDTLNLYFRTPKVEEMMAAEDNEELLIVVNPMEPHYLFSRFYHGCLQEASWKGGMEAEKEIDHVEEARDLHDMRAANTFASTEATEAAEAASTRHDDQAESTPEIVQDGSLLSSRGLLE